MRHLRGPALLALASGAEALAAFAVGVLVARSGGPDALGRLAAATALLLAAVTATEMGQNVVLTRRVAAGRPGARKGFGASLLSKSVASLLLTPFVLWLWPPDEPGWGALAAVGMLVLSSWNISATAVLRGGELFGRVATASCGSGALAIAGTLSLRPVRLSSVLAVLAAAQALKAALAFGRLPLDSRPELPTPGDLRGLLLETLPFAGVVGVGVVYLKADVVLLSALAGAAEAGRYAAAARVTEALKLLPTAVGAALFPALAAGERSALRRGVASAGAFGLAVIVFAMVAGAPALSALFGAPFAPAAAALRILSFTFLLASLNTLLVLALYARHHERAALAALSGALGVNLAANAVLIPAAGAVGAASASLVSEAMLLALYLRALMTAPVARGAPPIQPALADAGVGQ